MKEVKHYICDLCGTEYNCKNQAQRCEKNHKTPEKVFACRHISYSQNQAGYPQTITVTMSDGSNIVYKR